LDRVCLILGLDREESLLALQLCEQRVAREAGRSLLADDLPALWERGGATKPKPWTFVWTQPHPWDPSCEQYEKPLRRIGSRIRSCAWSPVRKEKEINFYPTY